MNTLSTEDLIHKYIEQDPYRPGKADARIKNEGVHVWALIGHMPEERRDATEIALAYRLPLEAVHAAIAFYERYRCIIDDRIAANQGDDW